jgi:DNA end-binding protein Ku
MFVPRGEVDPVYFNSPYYLYPDGQLAVEAIRVIGAAMAEADVVGVGRLTMSRRERMVMIEPGGAGMVLITLRAADEVRAPKFTTAWRQNTIGSTSVTRRAQPAMAFIARSSPWVIDVLSRRVRGIVKKTGDRVKPTAVTPSRLRDCCVPVN